MTASAVVPSREAVEALLAQYRRNDGTESPLVTTIRTLLAEVERLNGINSRMYDAYNKNVNELEQARATVAEQGAQIERIKSLPATAVPTSRKDLDPS
jgi:hypothetical protein